MLQVEYVDPPVDKDEINVWNNYRQIKCLVKDGNGRDLIGAWKRRDGKHIVVWRLDYFHTPRCLVVSCRNINAERCTCRDGKHRVATGGSCWETFDSIDDILDLVKSWETDEELLGRMERWYGVGSENMPAF